MRKVRDKDAVAEAVRNQIRCGELKAGDFLVSEVQLAAQCGVSVRAARLGIEQLQSEGLIERKRGRGSQILKVPGEPVTESSVRSKVIPVIFQGRIRDASTAELFDSIQQTLQAWGYSPLLHITSVEGDSLMGLQRREVEIVDGIVEYGYPGLIAFTGHGRNSFDHFSRARGAGVHVVLIDHDFAEASFDCVSIDDRQAAYQATEHLIRCGVKQIAFVSYNSDWSSSTRRRQGCVDACLDQGRNRPRIFELFDFPAASANAGELSVELRKLVAQCPGKLGIVATNDIVAKIALEALEVMDLKVPDAAAVIGINDDIDSSVNSPALSTMAIPRSEIGARAALLLMQKIHCPKGKPMRIQLTANLTIRDTCGCYCAERPSESVHVK